MGEIDQLTRSSVVVKEQLAAANSTCRALQKQLHVEREKASRLEGEKAQLEKKLARAECEKACAETDSRISNETLGHCKRELEQLCGSSDSRRILGKLQMKSEGFGERESLLESRSCERVRAEINPAQGVVWKEVGQRKADQH